MSSLAPQHHTESRAESTPPDPNDTIPLVAITAPKPGGGLRRRPTTNIPRRTTTQLEDCLIHVCEVLISYLAMLHSHYSFNHLGLLCAIRSDLPAVRICPASGVKLRELDCDSNARVFVRNLFLFLECM